MSAMGWNPTFGFSVGAMSPRYPLSYEEIYLFEHANLTALRTGVGKWFVRYNDWRPHATLGNLTPAAFYQNALTGPHKASGVTTPESTCLDRRHGFFNRIRGSSKLDRSCLRLPERPCGPRVSRSRLRAVADDVAATEDVPDAEAIDFLQHRLKSRKVGVNVGNDCDELHDPSLKEGCQADAAHPQGSATLRGVRYRSCRNAVSDPNDSR